LEYNQYLINHLEYTGGNPFFLLLPYLSLDPGRSSYRLEEVFFLKVLDDPNGCGLLLLVVILALVVTLAKLQSDRSKLLGADSTTPTGGSLVVIIGSFVHLFVDRRKFIS
jgi:hypothetical protein